ncbi:DUF4340 domain-containing protein [Methylomonas paludis]|uniref:DUF4340 domain-containing protein n=1 Tax=Methylomonas paludis TaxID=1173101 RepID=A0A975RAM7_9GAMM|nr:DUF4340 domain-containing protein [Methylomonas paludis]QWF72317.1 DUF4340 domain-containing protein [Methylomonas paludis]
MKKMQTWLVGSLVLQLLLAALIYWQQNSQQQAAPQALLAFNPEQLDKIVLSDAGHSVTLNKTAAGWIIPELKQLPADNSKLTGLLSKLQALQSGWPLATTAVSHQRFEVADDKYQRRLQLIHGQNPVAELLLGTSPGFKKSYLRRPGDDNVYAGNLSSFEVPVSNAEWLDKSLLAAGDAETIKGPDFVLEKKTDGWHFAAAANQTDSPAQLDQAKAQQLAGALAGLQVLALADNPPPASDPANKTWELQVSGKTGDRTYRFVQNADHYLVGRNDRDNLFSINKQDFERITQASRQQLSLAEPAPSTTPPEPPPASPKVPN